MSAIPPVALARHIDLTTARLDMLAREWIDWQKRRKAMAQRELPEDLVQDVHKIEERVARLLTKELRAHVLWPWLKQFPGLGGAHTALVIGRIGDPRRFPGQRCSEGHYLPPLYEVGGACPVAVSHAESDPRGGNGRIVVEHEPVIEPGPGHEDLGADDFTAVIVPGGVCPGIMLAPRTTTGVRSLWHWAGLHVEDDGKAPRKRKGVQCTWEPQVRASFMQPGGIAEQNVRLSVPHYSEVYRKKKARTLLRVFEQGSESETQSEDSELSTEVVHEIDCAPGRHPQGTNEERSEIDASAVRPLRLWEADRIARKIAAKKFLGDLLMEWKRCVAEDQMKDFH